MRKWNSKDPTVFQQIPEELRDTRNVHVFSEDRYSKSFGIEWNVVTDQVRFSIADFPMDGELTKRGLISDIAKVFDVLGFFFPATIKMKILLQRLWEMKIDWDEAVPNEVKDVWLRWRTELPSLVAVPIPRCYLPRESSVVRVVLHGFSDASEEAYAAVVYVCMTNSKGIVHLAH